MIAAFLDDLEKSRGITTRSRNLRLTAIAPSSTIPLTEEPSRAAQIQRVLAIPGSVTLAPCPLSLNRPEIDALLAAPNRRTGSAAAIMPCCWWPSKQVCAYRN